MSLQHPGQPGTTYTLALTQKQHDLIGSLLPAGPTPTPVPAADPAAALHISKASVGKIVERFNKAARDQAPIDNLIAARRGKGYQLNVARVTHTDDL